MITPWWYQTHRNDYRLLIRYNLWLQIHSVHLIHVLNINLKHFERSLYMYFNWNQLTFCMDDSYGYAIISEMTAIDDMRRMRPSEDDEEIWWPGC